MRVVLEIDRVEVEEGLLCDGGRHRFGVDLHASLMNALAEAAPTYMAVVPLTARVRRAYIELNHDVGRQSLPAEVGRAVVDHFRSLGGESTIASEFARTKGSHAMPAAAAKPR